MTRKEADEIVVHPERVEEQLGRPVKQQFDLVRPALNEQFVERYGPSRLDWRPPGSRLSIAEINLKAVPGMEDLQFPKLRGRRIKLQHYPLDALMRAEMPAEDDEDVAGPVYRHVAQTGCVVIVDELSLFHWDVHRAVVAGAAIFNSERAAIVTVSPLEHYGLEPHRVLRQALKDRLGEPFARFSSDCDPQCELSVGEETRLRRWLYASLPETIETLRSPRPNAARLARFAQDLNTQPDRRFAAELYQPGTL